MTRSGQRVNQVMAVGTPMTQWKQIRAPAAEDGASALTYASGVEFSDAGASAIDLWLLWGDSMSFIALGFFGADTAQATEPDDTFGLDLIGYRVEGGPPTLIASTAAAGCLLGTQQIVSVSGSDTHATGTAYWADSITLNFSDWLGAPEVFDHANNRIALLAFDLHGIRYLWPRIHGATGGVGIEVASVGCAGFTWGG